MDGCERVSSAVLTFCRSKVYGDERHTKFSDGLHKLFTIFVQTLQNRSLRVHIILCWKKPDRLLLAHSAP